MGVVQCIFLWEGWGGGGFIILSLPASHSIFPCKILVQEGDIKTVKESQIPSIGFSTDGSDYPSLKVMTKAGSSFPKCCDYCFLLLSFAHKPIGIQREPFVDKAPRETCSLR